MLTRAMWMPCVPPIPACAPLASNIGANVKFVRKYTGPSRAKRLRQKVFLLKDLSPSTGATQQQPSAE